MSLTERNQPSPDTTPLMRSRFRAPDGRLIVHGPVEGERATHALLSKDDQTMRWIVIGAYPTREAAEHELEHQTISAPMVECLIIEHEPY